MAQNISLMGANFTAVPAILLPKTGGGTARFDDASVTTAEESDVASGKIFLKSNGSIATGTNSGGGGTPTVKTVTKASSTNTATSLSFTVDAEPVAFFVKTTFSITSTGSTTYYYVQDIRYNGSATTGNYFRIGSSRATFNTTTHYSFSYSNGTLTVTSSGSRTSSGGSFYNGTYELTYVY